jgi:glycosyltransferase involved in cell wall biosynthesis
MRIAITLQSLDPTWGGIGIYTEQIVRHLLQIDQSNEYVLIYPGFGAARSRLGQFQRKYDNVTEVETSSSRLPIGTYWDQVIVPPVAKAHRPDLLFNPFWSVPMRGDYKKVIIMHAVELHTMPSTFDLRQRLQWLLRDFVLTRAVDTIISISHLMARDLITYLKLPPEKIRTIYHGVGEHFQIVKDEARLAYARSEYRLPDRFILFVGFLYPQKNFGSLLRAFHKIAGQIPHDLVVAGRPRWKFQEELVLMEQLGLKDRVRFLYFVAHDELPLIYNLADCFVCPSFYEAFGLAGVEAMACGCPVAASNAAALPEVLGDAALLFDPHDPDAIADALLTLLNDQEVRRSYIDKGLVRARRYSWDRCARETLQLFDALVAGR